MPSTRTAFGVVALASALLLGACSNPTEGKFGEELFQAACARCHADDGSGGRGPALGPGSDAATMLTDDQIRGVIRVGPGVMPAWPRLTDEQVDSLVVYLRLLQRGE
jgi:mono/diheme cytochrome c family protein